MQSKIQTPISEIFARSDEIIKRLESCYGVPKWHRRLDPMNELIACILSQHTSDVNSFRAFESLKKRYSEWQEVIDAPTKEIADTIRRGGLADSKALRIQTVLKTIQSEKNRLDLDFLEEMSDTDARAWLLSLPGVGPKTAAIVLCFSMGRPVIAVDTHVFRVSWRLGLVEKKIGEGKAHDVLQAQVPPEKIYRFHVALITHGRQICKAPTPRCSECLLTDLCQTFQREEGKGEREN